MTILASFNELHEIIGSGGLLAAILCALAVGSRPWKLAALVMALETLSWIVFASTLDGRDRVMFGNGKSIFVALLFAAIVYRSSGVGLMLLASLQFVAVLIHISIWADRSIGADVNALVLNAIGWLMLAVLTLGSILSRSTERSQAP